MKIVNYKGNIFNYYNSCKYSGKSILTENIWNIGTSIFWSTKIKKGFTYQEALDNNLNIIDNSDNFHYGSNNVEITYDDSNSRELTKKLFKKEFDIDLIEPTQLSLNINNKNFKLTDGQYCIDLCAIDNKNENIIALVEVERYKNEELFDKNNQNASVLVSKYWKYFHSYNPDITCLCYINETINKACIILGKDIKNNKKIFKELTIDGKIKHIYELPNIKKRIYDLS